MDTRDPDAMWSGTRSGLAFGLALLPYGAAIILGAQLITCTPSVTGRIVRNDQGWQIAYDRPLADAAWLRPVDAGEDERIPLNQERIDLADGTRVRVFAAAPLPLWRYLWLELRG